MARLRCCLLLLLLAGAQSATVFSLTTDYAVPGQTQHSGSLAGGTMLFVDGTNLMTSDPGQVRILVGGQECIFDHFLMKESYVECDTPAAANSLASSTVPITVSYQGQIVPIAAAANPFFTYTSARTAVVYGICPALQTPMKPVAFFGDWKTEGDNSLYMEFKVDKKHMEFLPELSTFTASGTSFIVVNLGDNVAGEKNITARLAASYGLAQFHWTATQYTLSGQPYYLKAVAEVTKVTHQDLEWHTGSLAGGLSLTLSGAGFPTDPSRITVEMEGNPCTVTSAAYDKVVCTTSARTLTVPGPVFEGGAGLRHHRWYGRSLSERPLLDSAANITDTLPQAESFPPDNDLVDLIFVERWTGLFKAPRTGSYTFYVSSDDGCEVWISTDATAANKQKVINFGSYTGFRDMLSSTATRSAPVAMVIGQAYYIEIWHQQLSGATHFSLGVQIPSSGSSSANNLPSVQLVSIVPFQLIREVQRVSFSKLPIGGQISFSYKGKTTDPVNWPSTGTEWKCGDVLKAMQGLGIGSLGCAVDRTAGLAYDFSFNYAWTDVRGLIVAGVGSALPGGMSASTLQKTKASKPLGGSYKLSWRSVVTGDIPILASAGTVQSQLNANFTAFQGKLIVTGSSNPDGVSLLFTFGDTLNPTGSVPLLLVSSSITGGPDDTVPIATVNETIAACTDQFWWSVPSEFFRTAETAPYIHVYVDGQPAVCTGNCAFQYRQDSPIVKGVTYAAAVQITGENFPATVGDITVSIGGANCIVTACTTTSISCNQQAGLVGSHTPKVLLKGSGFAVLDPAVPSTTYTLAITSVSPAAGSVGGGTLLTLQGTGFVPVLGMPGATHSVKVGNSPCAIQSSVGSTTGSSLTCVTSPQTTTSQITLNVNSDSIPAAGFSYDSAISPTIASISPTYASTIVKTTLTITGSNFGPSAAGSVTVMVGSVECYVTASSATVITCNLLGGPTGKWLLVVRIPGRGNAVSEQYPLVFNLVRVSPQSGSVAGGTLLTLTGNGLSTRASQLLVQIVDQTHLCDVEGTPTEQQVKCRTPPRTTLAAEASNKVILLGRISEEAICATPSDCTFTYSVNKTPVITSLSLTSGPAASQVDIIGTGFGTNQATTRVLIGSQSAVITTQTASQISIIIPSQEAGVYSVTVTFDEIGTAMGTFSFTQTLQVTTVAPLTGSQAGSIVTVSGSGFAPTAVVKFGTVICSRLSGDLATIRCRLGPGASTTAQLLNIQQSGGQYTCQSAGTCGFTFSSALTPTLTSATNTGLVVATGTGYSLNSADMQLTIGGVACVVTDSTTTQVTGTCAPPSGSQPVEVFVLGKGYAIGSAKLTTAFTASGATGVGSFKGGSVITLTGSGLGPGTSVSLCNFPCAVTQASYSSLTCTSPALPSDFSQPKYSLMRNDTEITTGFTSSPSTANNPFSKAFDGNFSTYTQSDTTPCSFQYDSLSGRQLLLSGIALYPAEDSYSTYKSMVGTTLSMSSDGVNWALVYTFNVMYAGWNYWNVLPDDGSGTVSVYKARYFKVGFPTASKCRVAEFKLIGVLLQSDATDTLNCPVIASDLSTGTTATAGSFSFRASATPEVTAVTPKVGTILGGTPLTFTGQLLSLITSVAIDGVPCTVTVATATSFTCTSGARNDLQPASIVITTPFGLATTKDVTFLYADRWSASSTWGGEVPPKQGETVQIPAGLTLLLDVPTPKLMLLLIEGALIVEDVPGITLDANYIFINRGSFQVGTPALPYQNQFTLTLHGRRESPMMPIYGNKVLAVYRGVLDMHGIPRTVTWTSLEYTINPYASSFTVQVATDWKVGESVVVASTSYDHTDAEERVITAVSGGGKEFTVSKPFLKKHYAATETYGSQTIDMRAEVGLLTRNVRVRGSEEGLDQEHGAHIMAYSKGDDSVIARITYIEIFNAGQAYSIGAYPIHFHMIGAVRNSFIIGNGIHHTFNRAITIHAIQYLRVIDNVSYHTKGHTIFVEDGAEMKNRIVHNLVVSVRRSWSRLNTDTTPAGIWVTNPDNYVTDNHVAGSDAYGIWFDFKANPTGPSATTLICPVGTPLAEFNNNVAHSNGKYGFRLFHGHIPRTYPCLPATNSTALDPWADNPPVTAVYRNFVGYKNKRNGAIADRVGDVRWQNFKVADNLLAGIEITYTLDTKPFTIPFLSNALIVGKSLNTEADVSMDGSIGFIGPQSDGLIAENLAFYNFDNSMYALGDESHSSACTTRDHGGRHNKLRGLTFGNANKRVHWEFPRRSFYEIEDASYNGRAGAFVAAFWPHLLWEPYCTYDEATYNGIICDGTKVIRRVHMLDLQPSQTFGLMQITVRRAAGSNLPMGTGRFLPSEPNYWWTSMGPVGGAQYHNIPKAWAVPMIMGTEYLVHWGTTPMDWTSMTIRIETFDDPSLWVHVRFNFTDHREMFEVRRGTLPAGTKSSAVGFVDPTLLPSQAALTPTSPAGASSFDNTTAMEFRTVLTGQPVIKANSGDLQVKAYRCYGGHCTLKLVDDNVTMETFKRVWSNPNSWPSGAIPVEGESITIEPGWSMILDTNTAIMSFLEVNGDLVFDNTTSVTLNANMIHVRKGRILSGSQQYPLLPNITHQIVINGTFNSLAYAFDPNIEVVNKALIITGNMQLYGAKRRAWVRLVQNAKPGDTAIFVERTNWQAGDQIVLTSSSFYQNETEINTVASVQGDIDLVTGVNSGVDLGSDALWTSKESTKSFGRYSKEMYKEQYDKVDSKTVTKLTLSQPLQYYHAGTTLLVNGSPMDMRGEVGVLTSNIIIRGTENGWTCNFVVADFVDYSVVGSNPILRSGSVTLDSIAIDYCGQNSTLRTGLRFESTTLPSVVSNSIVKRSQTYSVNIQNSKNVRLLGNTFFYAVRFGVFVQHSSDLLIDGNLMINVTQRPTISLPFDKPTGYVICPEERANCPNVVVSNNVAAGYALLGFADGGYQCGKTATFYNNVAHSGVNGWITSNTGAACVEMSGFRSYFNSETAVVGSMDGKEIIFSNLQIADSYNGYGGNMGGERDSGNLVTIKDSLIVGKTGHSFCDPNECWTPQCGNRRGIIFSTYLVEAKQWTINGKLKLPIYNVSKEAVFNAEFHYENIVFANFNSTDLCKANITALATNELSSDYTPVQIFSGVKLINVANDSIFYMADPDPQWASLLFCGEFPCTGLRNAIVRDMDGGLVGSSNGGYLLPNNPGIIHREGCTFVGRSNGYMCQKSQLFNYDYALLMFENLDIDTREVTISPIYITSEDPILNVNSTHYYNKLNSFMSHIWDGFYVGTNRLGRFPTAIGLNRKFNVTFTATAPERMRYQLQGALKWTDSVVLTVNYKEPYSVKVKLNGTEQWYLPYGQHVNLTAPSGTNRWLHEDRMMQFIIRPGDIVELIKVDCIQVSIRMNMTTDEFFATNGQTEFIDRLASVLGIPPYRIRVASIRSGSTICDTFINADEALTSKRASSTSYSNAGLEDLTRLNALLLAKASDGTLILNAPVLSVNSSIVAVSPSLSPGMNTNSSSPTTVTPGTSPVDITDPPGDSDSSGSITWWGILLITAGSLAAVVFLVGASLGMYCWMRKKAHVQATELVTQPAEPQSPAAKADTSDKLVDITHEIVDFEEDENQRPLSEIRPKPSSPQKSAHVSVHW